MSAVTLVFLLSPTPTSQSRYALLAPSRAELCRCSWGGVIRGQKDSGVSKSRNRVAAKAGLGRFSGAIHGSSTRRARRRRPMIQSDGGDENDSAVQRQEDNLDTAYGESCMDGVIHDDGEPASDLTDSHQRYLSELRIIQNDGNRDYQLHNCNGSADCSTWVPIGTEGDLGYEQVDVPAFGNSLEDGRRANGSGSGQSLAGSDGDGSGKEDSTIYEDRKFARGRKIKKNNVDLSQSARRLADVETFPVEGISNPEIFPEGDLKSPSKEVDATVKSVTSHGDFKPDSSIQPTEISCLDNKDMSLLLSSEVSGKNRKQRRKTRKKSGMNTAVIAELQNDEGKVRVLQGEAEQPSVAQTVPLNQRRWRVKADNNEEITSAGAKVELQTTVGVLGSEEREGSGMVKDIHETHETRNRAENFGTGPEAAFEEPVNRSTATLINSVVDHVDVSGGEPSRAFSLLDSEHFDELVGARSAVVNAEAEEEVVETYTEAETEDMFENRQVGIDSQPNVATTPNFNSAVLDSRSCMKSSNLDFLTTSSLSKQKGPAVVALELGAENDPSAEAMILTNPIMEQAVQIVSKMAELPAQIATKVVELPTQVASKVVELPAEVASKVAELPAQVASKVVELPAAVVEQATQVGTLVVEQVAEILPDAVTEQVGQVVRQVSATAEQVVQVAESVTSTANEVVEQVTGKVTDILSLDEDDESDSDDEFEAYKTSDDPAFRGSRGLANFVILQEDKGLLGKIYNFYTYMLKQPLPNFAAAMFSAPIGVSVLFTLLYLPEYKGLAFDDTLRDFFAATDGNPLTLQMSWTTVFQVFMFSLSLSTGLQPELAPLSPYTLVVANINALVAQLVFVFLSGAVFARLSQPAEPVLCSNVALVSTSPAQRKRKENAIKVLMARYVLVGPQPCELVDVKVDLTYKYNTITRTGSYFRATQSLKLVRPEIAFLTHGMLVRHVIDSSSPLYQRTPEMLKKEDAVFVLSIVGLERSSMQSIFHVQHYCVCDDHVIWDAEFEDLILINSKKSKRIVDHSRLSMWRSIKI